MSINLNQKQHSNRTIGILGGMGPQASCELYRLTNERSSATNLNARNADFPHLLINNIPVPDLINDTKEKERCISMVCEGAMSLQKAGATDILMSCNTMHLFQKRITKGLKARFHSLVDIVSDSMKGSKKVLLLGTKTTIETGLYQEALKKRNISYKEPSKDLCNMSVEVILGTISQTITQNTIGSFTGLVINEASGDKDIDTIGLVCTELPLIFPKKLKTYQIVSSLNEAAKYIISMHQKDYSFQAM